MNYLQPIRTDTLSVLVDQTILRRLHVPLRMSARARGITSRIGEVIQVEGTDTLRELLCWQGLIADLNRLWTPWIACQTNAKSSEEILPWWRLWPQGCRLRVEPDTILLFPTMEAIRLPPCYLRLGEGNRHGELVAPERGVLAEFEQLAYLVKFPPIRRAVPEWRNLAHPAIVEVCDSMIRIHQEAARIHAPLHYV